VTIGFKKILARQGETAEAAQMDRLEPLERQISKLMERIDVLERNIEYLSSQTKHPVEELLWQLGFPVISHGGMVQLLFPPNIASSSLVYFYRMMNRYSFRLFIRDLIQIPEGDELGALTRYCSLRTVKSYLGILAEMGIVCLADKGYRLVRKVPSFGRTLEWYVCEILRREFLAPALRRPDQRRRGRSRREPGPGGQLCLGSYIRCQSAPSPRSSLRIRMASATS